MHTFLMLGFFLVAVASLGFIIGRSIGNYESARRDRPKVVRKGLAAFVVWLALSSAMTMIQFVVVYAAAHSGDGDAPIGVTPAFFAANVLYLLAMLGVAFWIRQGESGLR